jgi:hypothetical protein
MAKAPGIRLFFRGFQSCGKNSRRGDGAQKVRFAPAPNPVTRL